jgi:hypothetical protein
VDQRRAVQQFDCFRCRQDRGRIPGDRCRCEYEQRAKHLAALEKGGEGLSARRSCDLREDVAAASVQEEPIEVEGMSDAIDSVGCKDCLYGCR